MEGLNTLTRCEAPGPPNFHFPQPRVYRLSDVALVKAEGVEYTHPVRNPGTTKPAIPNSPPVGGYAGQGSLELINHFKIVLNLFNFRYGTNEFVKRQVEFFHTFFFKLTGDEIHINAQIP